MYRLLIVTENQAVWDMFAAMEGWEAMGFKIPRLRRSMDEAIECMHKHHIDAIAVDGTKELAPLCAYLDEQHPYLPVFQIERDADAQMETIRKVNRLLSRLHADDSNDSYDEASWFEQLRNRWMKKALSGLVSSGEELKKELRLYRCMEKPGTPCIMARISLPSDDGFMSDRWHYGSERLETALRNFFGSSHDHMLLHVAVISPEEVRVLCYPMEPQTGLSETVASDYIHETVEQIEKYLGLHMEIIDLRRVPGIEALAADQITKYAM